MQKRNYVMLSLVLTAACGAPAAEGGAQAVSQGVSSGQIFNFGTLAHPGACMDAQGSGTQNGVQIQEWWCNGSGAQSFALADAGNGAFYVVNTNANKCVDVQARGTANGTKIQLWDCNQTPAQSFWVNAAANGFVTFVNTNSGKCLDVTADNPADGTTVQLYDCNGTNAQLWNPAVIGNAGGGGGGGGGGGYNLIWSDEFNAGDGSAVDASKWAFDIGGGGWGNQELEYYTNSTANSRQQGGSLVITATRDNAGSYGCWYGQCQYTSARLLTAGHFNVTYGRIESRIKIPAGQGLWPAFWMLGDDIGSAGWPTCGEIDIMENIGREPGTVHGSMHGPGYSGGNPLTAVYTLPGGARFADDYHLFAVEWEPGVARFYVDSTLYETRTPADVPGGAKWVYDHPFFLLLNVAVGGGWPGSPDGSTSFPQEMLVDYVRVYQK